MIYRHKEKERAENTHALVHSCFSQNALDCAEVSNRIWEFSPSGRKPITTPSQIFPRVCFGKEEEPATEQKSKPGTPQ